MTNNNKASKNKKKPNTQTTPEQSKKGTEKSSTFKVGALIISIILVLAFALPSAAVLLSLSSENEAEKENTAIEETRVDFHEDLSGVLDNGEEN